MGIRVVARNRRAGFQYALGERYTAGIVLVGTEIKSIRMGRASLTETYCLFIAGELWVRNLHIPEYLYGTHYNHNPTRDRKLLLTSRELRKLERGVQVKGATIVATELFLSERGYAKLTIALARGKQSHDKRETLRARDAKRELDRARRREG